MNSVLAALQYESTESQPVSLLAAGTDLFFREPVAVSLRIAPSYAAIETVVFAITGYFDQAPDIDVRTVILSAHPVRPVIKALSVIISLY